MVVNLEQRYSEEDFIGYLKDLNNIEHFEGPAAGIIKQVLHLGHESLTANQMYVLTNHVILPHYVDECDLCANDIPWCEMMDAEEDGLCSWCKHMTEKDDWLLPWWQLSLISSQPWENWKSRCNFIIIYAALWTFCILKLAQQKTI